MIQMIWQWTAGHVLYQISITKFSIPSNRKQGRPRNPWRLMSISVAWLALTHMAAMHVKPVFDIAWCYQLHKMGHEQHLNLNKTDVERRETLSLLRSINPNINRFSSQSLLCFLVMSLVSINVFFVCTRSNKDLVFVSSAMSTIQGRQLSDVTCWPFLYIYLWFSHISRTSAYWCRKSISIIQM